ncbi:NAD-dependent epimerase/dehydratase family protein [Kineococcus sp. NPDC059986]|uniref:NAD-dependent epimerase/dehydratase family protein n=1 Tax=Kineococcus sp. NPDC059986 TaxID=3155538 RepID=UPI00344FB6B8
MDVVGDGFLAGRLAPLRPRHDRAVVLAAGVSWAAGTDAAAFAREERLVRRHADRARAEGRVLVFFSTASSGLYGAGPGVEDGPVTACTPYARHKHRLEQVVAASGAEHLVLRLSHVVGPGNPGHQLMPSLARQVRAGRVVLHRDATRDLVGVDEVVDALDRLLAAGASGGVVNEVVNVASGTSVPVALLVDLLEARLGVRAERREVVVANPRHRVDVVKLRRLVGELPAFSTDPLHRLAPALDDLTAGGGPCASSS